MKEYIFNLSDVMKRQGMTTAELSEKTGIKEKTISEYRGSRRKEPTLYRGLLIADALGVSPWDLFIIKE